MKIKEELLYYFWDSETLLEELVTASGLKLRIAFPGLRNKFEGPDFKNAVIKFENRILRGDIELHINESDWYLHHHHSNPEYDNTILHVVYKNDRDKTYTTSISHNQIEILELNRYVSKQLLFDRDNQNYTNKYCNFFSHINNDELFSILRILGMKRLESNIRRFSSELLFSDFNQIFITGFLEALGYEKNKLQMIKLSEFLTIDYLRCLKENVKSKENMIAILLGNAGLLEKASSFIDTELFSKWIMIYEKFTEFQKDFHIKWNLFRIRPKNHPVIRLIQFVEFIYDSIDVSVFNKVLSIFSFSERNFNLSSFKKLLYKNFQGLNTVVSDNYTLGKSRIDTLLINIIIPLGIVYAEKLNYPKLKKLILTLYNTYPKLPQNNIILKMKTFMDETQYKMISHKEITQQGLIWLYKKNCIYHQCDKCKYILN